MKKCDRDSEKAVDTFIRFKMQHSSCASQECNIEFLRSMCLLEMDVPSLKAIVSILLRRTPNGNCDIDCTRKKLKDVTEKTTREILELVMEGRRLKLPKGKTGLSISYYDSQTDVICDAGFEMKDFDSKLLCVPCKPGHFLDGKYCIPCHLNHYSKNYGAIQCKACDIELKTRKRGASSSEECTYLEAKRHEILKYAMKYCALSFVSAWNSHLGIFRFTS
ncbi:uncharacterized protein [Parasteatoda tepidariorum]|uniref:uncharacterized protein n=1 Tax=Parasteatoda tepidariorum TaxID=114398 RepID=UPI0039BD6329